MRRVVAVVLVGTVGVLGAGCSGGEPDTATPTQPPRTTPSQTEDEGPTSSLGQTDVMARSDVEIRVAELLEELDAVDEPEGATVEIPDTVLFAFDSDELEPGAAAVLDGIVEVLLLLEDAPAVVRGHTDDVGDDDYNLDLSQRRADAVVAHLVDAGVDAGLLTAEGLGEAEPIVPNDSDEQRARNRRVEVVLPTVDLDDLTTTPDQS